MKKWKKIAAVLAATFALSIGAASMAYAAEGEINVNGTGIVQVDPDTADVYLSIESKGKTAQTAQKENSKLVQSVTKAMQEMGIAKENIVTTYTSAYPEHRYDNETGKSTIIGYCSTTDLKVTTKDINNAGKYIDAALKAGATRVNGVEFSLSDQSAYYCQALQVAVKNAEKSATSIAQAFGKQLGAVKSVTETSRNMYHVESAELPMMKEEASMDMSTNSVAGTAISYGKIQITANITVTYAF